MRRAARTQLRVARKGQRYAAQHVAKPREGGYSEADGASCIADIELLLDALDVFAPAESD